MPVRKKQARRRVEFDAMRADEEALSPLPFPYFEPGARDDDSCDSPTGGGTAHQRVVSEGSDFSGVHFATMQALLSERVSSQEVDEETPLVFTPSSDLLRSTPMPRNLLRSTSELTDDDNDDPEADNYTATGAHSILTGTKESILEGTETIIEGAREIIADIEVAAQEAWTEYDDKRHYDWREFWQGGNPFRFARWLVTGFTEVKQSDDDLQDNLNSLARMLSLLREYHDRFGMPEFGGPKDQEYVLRQVTKDLYYGGAPIWALEPVMKKVAEGLTGKRGVDFFMLPRRAFIFAPSSGATSMFSITRGYDMQRLDAMETVAVRLASFATNTGSSSSVPARWPKPQELRRAFRSDSVMGVKYAKEELAEEILTLASEDEGLFFFINTQRTKLTRDSSNEDMIGSSQLGEFWQVEDTARELFSRLAAIEAAENIEKVDVERKRLYSPAMVTLFRVGSSAGACCFWFDGSWFDIVVSGVLALLVAWIGQSPLLNKQERIIFEAVASFCVGLVSGLISLTWPEHTCFGAMAISGVLDLLQGFRVVYAVIEIMSRHSVTGAADFLEGVFFTTLIAYFIRFGEYVSVQILGEPSDDHHFQCTNGVNAWWYLLMVPLAAVSWSGLFNPHYVDLPFMAAHGILGYLVSWQFDKTATANNLNNFIAAMCVTFSAGLMSRFTGRQALGNTVAGLYVLLPGAYLVTTVYSDRIEGFLTSIVIRAVIIGIGAWTGTILCSPTLLGVNRGLIKHDAGMPSLVEGGSNTGSDTSMSSMGSGVNFRRRRGNNVRKEGAGSLLFF